MKFFQAEQADAEAAEICRFIALQRDAGSGLESGADELLASLHAQGFSELSVSVIQPGIEDTFIALMEEKQGAAHE